MASVDVASNIWHALIHGDLRRRRSAHGRAVQVDPIIPTLKAPGTKRLKLQYDELLSSCPFKFSLRRYTTADDVVDSDTYKYMAQLKSAKTAYRKAYDDVKDLRTAGPPRYCFRLPRHGML
jgi:hypothetical protein